MVNPIPGRDMDEFKGFLGIIFGNWSTRSLPYV